MKKALLMTLVCFFTCSNGFSNELHLNKAMNAARNYLLINYDKSPDSPTDASTIFHEDQAAILDIKTTSVNPCTQIVSLGGGGPENAKTFTSEGMGLWATDACGYTCNEKEGIYSFTAPHTGIYTLQVTESNNTFIDYFWKSGTCSSSGWNCIGWFYGPATKGNMNWTGGTTYYILADAESTDFSMQTFHINVPEPPGTWLGTASSNWHQSSNWSAGIIPNSSVDVTIPSGTPHSPAILSGDANCKSLTINSGATLSIFNRTLTIDGNLTVFGTIGMHQNDGKINIMGNTAWNSGSSLNVTASLTFINAYGHWDFNAGSAVNPAMGFVDFRGSNTSWIRCFSSNSSFYNLRIYKTGGASANFSWLGGEDLVVNDLLFISSIGAFESHSNNNLILKGNFNYYGTFDFTKNINTGSVVFAGSSQSVNNYNSGSGVFNNVVCNSSTGTTIINGDLTIAGNLTIDQGYLSSGSNTIHIEGNWTNNNFPTGFNAGTGRVIFNGAGHQYVNSSENFNILEANMGAAIRINDAAHTVTCNQYDWKAGGIDVIAGTFTANDLAQNGLYGGFWVNPGGTINIVNSTGLDWVDLRGSVHILGGTMNLTGTAAWWPYANGANFTMTGGVLDFKTCGLRIDDLFTWTYNITGGTIRTAHHYSGVRTDFSPTAGTFEFYGSSNANITQSLGNTLRRVVINKDAARDEEKSGKPLYDERSGELISDGGRSGAITLGSDFIVTNDLVVESGTLNIGGHELTVNKKADIYGTLNMTNAAGVLNIGTLQFDNLSFFSGSAANLLNGNVYLRSWIVAEEGSSFLASTDNTIHIVGGNLGGGLANNEPTALFGNVEINKTANPAFFSSISTGPYNIQGDFTIHPGNTFYAGTQPCKVSGSFNDHATSSLLLFYPKNKGESNVSSEKKKSIGFYGNNEKSGPFEIDNYFAINGLMDVDAGSVLSHGGFQIAETGTLNITSGSFIMDAGYVKSAKAWQDIYGTLNLSSGLFEVSHNSINLRPTAAINITGGIIRCGFSFSVETPGIFTPTGGVVEFIGHDFTPFIRSVAGNWFNNLKINRSEMIVLRTDVEVKGDVEIISGPFNTYGILGQFDIFVGGNWTNTGGASAFDPGTGRVTFNGATDQICSAEAFNILEINKPGGHVIIPSATTCEIYDWKSGGITVDGGSFTANDLLQMAISGSYILNDNGVISIHQDANNFVDLNADITINSGTMNIYGGIPGSTSWWPSPDASLTMSGGVLDIKDQTIYIRNVGTFNSNITGGTIRTSKGYMGNRSDFNPAAGTFEFYGPDNAFISQDNGSTLHNVIIDKGNAIDKNMSTPVVTHCKREGLPLSDGGKSGMISLFSDFGVTNNLDVNSGSLDLAGNTLNVERRMNVDGTLHMTDENDQLNIGQSSSDGLWFFEGSTANITHGTIYCKGWVVPGTGSQFDLGIDNTIYFTGTSGGGLSSFEPTASYGNIVFAKNSGHAGYFDFSSTQPAHVKGSFTIAPGNTLILQNNSLIIDGTCDWDPTSYVYLAFYRSKEAGGNSSAGSDQTSSIRKTTAYLELNAGFDLKGFIDIANGDVLLTNDFRIMSTGILNISGGSFINSRPYSEFWTDIFGTLNMTDGLFELTYNHPQFYGSAATNISGGIIRTGGGFAASGAPVFQPSGGTVEISGQQPVAPIYCYGGNHFHNLVINRAGLLTQFMHGEPVSIQNDFVVDNGEIRTGSSAVSISGNTSVNAGGKLVINAGASLLIAGNKSLTINDSGMLDVSGTAGNKAVISGISKSHYAFNVESGATIRARNGIFEYMDVNGINIKPGALVQLDRAFTDCTFRNGQAGGSLLTVNNDQEFSVIRADFPENTWGGLYNVAKTVNSGHVEFKYFTGEFAGSEFENDAYNRIDWFEPMLAADPLIRNVTPPAGETTFDVISNLSWWIAESVEWLEVSHDWGTNNETITITYDANHSPDARTGHITLSADDVPDVTLTVTQAGVTLAVTPASQAVGAPPGTTTFEVESNTAWTVSESVAWLTVAPMAGSGDALLTVTYDANTDVTPRSGAITLSADGVADAVVMVHQAGAESETPIDSLVENETVDDGFSACYDAWQSIVVQNFIIENGGTVHLIAGENIVMLPGTHAKAGSYLHAHITTTGEFCSSLISMLAAKDPGKGATHDDMPLPVPLPDLEKGKMQFRIFPNPTKGLFTLELAEAPANETPSMEIYTLMGERVMSEQLYGDTHHRFDLSSRPKGIYIVRVTAGGQIVTQRLVKH